MKQTGKKNAIQVILLGIAILTSLIILKILFPLPPSSTVLHQIDSFGNTPNLVVSGDIITGKGQEAGYAVILITPRQYGRKIKLDSDNRWEYTIPKTIPRGIYTITVTLLDTESKFISSSAYTIKIN